MKKSNVLHDKISTHFLRLALIAVGGVVTLLAVLILRGIYSGWNDEYPALDHLRFPLVTVITLSLAPFWYAIVQAYKLLHYVDTDTAFSRGAVRALTTIRRCAFVFGALYALNMYVIFEMAQIEDAPGLILIIGSIFVGIPVAIGVFMAVLEKLLKSALGLKAENELTV